MIPGKVQIIGLRTAGILFGLMAIAQLLRLIIRPEVLVSGHAIPLWPSILAFMILTGMSIWMLGLSRNSRPQVGAM